MKQKTGLLLVIALYTTLGVAYAVRTPMWQTPDEPAHFNYIKHIAEGRGLPVLQEGDYDQDYLERLKAAKFPSDMPVDTLRYESHQPPLYYVLATPIYLATRSLSLPAQVLALRLLSVFLGCVLIVVSYAAVRRVFPKEPLLALATCAFIATLPQHVAMSAAINNDTLAEVVLSLILLVLVYRLGRPERGQRKASSRSLRRFDLTPYILGVLLGLALLTKTTIYVSIILVPLAALLVRSQGKAIKKAFGFRPLLVVCGLALVISGWWFVRNVMVYGDTDLFGLQRHDLVVAAQPRTGEFDLAAAKNLAVVSFKSFWAQFGWMGVPADARTYAVLGTVSVLAVLGLVLFLLRALADRQLLSWNQRSALLLMAATFILVFLEMFLYNLRYLQPQGRYLFPAILPIGVFFTLGVRELVRERYAPLFFSLLFAGLLLLNVFFLARLIPQLWQV